MPHPAEHGDFDRPLGAEEAEVLAEAMRAFGTASRLRLLWAMLDGEHTVEALAESIDASHSATSHQLRLLRQSRLVAVRRTGRHAHYRLHDHHLADLLAAMRHHLEHVDPPAPVTAPADAASARRSDA